MILPPWQRSISRLHSGGLFMAFVRVVAIVGGLDRATPVHLQRPLTTVRAIGVQRWLINMKRRNDCGKGSMGRAMSRWSKRQNGWRISYPAIRSHS